jgi:hypothetical protein
VRALAQISFGQSWWRLPVKIRNPMANAFFPAPFALENYQDRCTAARYGFQPLPRRDWRFKSEPSRVPRVDKIVIVGATQEAVVPAAASEPIEADVLCDGRRGEEQGPQFGHSSAAGEIEGQVLSEADGSTADGSDDDEAYTGMEKQIQEARRLGGCRVFN